MRLKKIKQLFEDGNICVCGLRGRGKDMLMGNIIIRRNKPYMSNTDYGGEHYPLDIKALEVSGNTYKNFISNNINKYEWNYPEECDIYISDCGVYFPSQYCNELNKLYGQIAVFQALSRQIGKVNMHVNAQSLNRIWDKIREQSDTYILCRKCWVLFGKIVIQYGTIYDEYESAVHRRKPLKLPKGKLMDKEYNLQRQNAIATYEANHGQIKNFITIYWNKSTYNTRIFKEILANGKEN